MVLKNCVRKISSFRIDIYIYGRLYIASEIVLGKTFLISFIFKFYF